MFLPAFRMSSRETRQIITCQKGLFDLNSKGMGGFSGTTIYASTGSGGRGQSSLSGGGAAWESLVAWYTNLCLEGAPALVFKKHSHIPAPIRDALSVSYKGVDSNKEADLVAVTFPESAESLESNVTDMHALTVKLFRQISVAVIQCKTNWNDNSQIPMLWNLLYETLMVAKVDGVTLGRNGHFLNRLKSFAYAFVTVPTNNPELIRPESLSARRVQNLSGGNYWGRDTRKGVAKSIFEIFGRASIGPDGGTGLRDHISLNTAGVAGIPDYFRLKP
jgi:hypothetical protein